MQEVLGDVPKPMARIGDRPFLEYLVLHLRKYDVREVILCTGHRWEQVQEYFGDGQRWGIHILHSREEALLGTAGALKLAGKLIRTRTVIAMNGDSFLDVNLTDLVHYHLTKSALATVALAQVPRSSRYGAVTLNEAGEISSFVEKRQGQETMLINGGVYVLDRSLLDRIPEGQVSLETEVFPKLVEKGFYGMIVLGYFVDIGVSADYDRLKANAEVLQELLEAKGGRQTC